MCVCVCVCVCVCCVQKGETPECVLRVSICCGGGGGGGVCVCVSGLAGREVQAPPPPSFHSSVIQCQNRVPTRTSAPCHRYKNTTQSAPPPVLHRFSGFGEHRYNTERCTQHCSAPHSLIHVNRNSGALMCCRAGFTLQAPRVTSLSTSAI